MKKCPRCNRTYADESFSFCFEDGALLSASYDPDATLVIPAAISSTSRTFVEKDRTRSESQFKLPIELVPSDPLIFKQQLLRSRVAEIATMYSDGRVRTKIWKATRFSASSNVIGNLRSRPEFRAGQWQAQGIVKVTVRVIEDIKIMSAEPYPPASMSHLVRRVPNEAASNIGRDWIGNDESARSHHGKVPLSESPLRLRLSWKKGPKDSAHLVGIFELDLKQLLSAGYIRYEAKSQDEIRLRFYHDWDNVVKIQVNSKQPGLHLGRVP